MAELYPPIEPYAAGLLDAGDGTAMYREACGNPAGKPAVFVHGGPGTGSGPNMRRGFDPERYQVVLFDQRGCDVSAAYARLMEDPDPAVRARAASDWLTWEDAVVSLEPAGKRNFYRDRTSDSALAFVRICAHYAAHGAWLAEGELLAGAGKLAGIPGVLIHGRIDLSCPLETAWELARAWPAAELITIADGGHQGNPGERDAYLAALDGFARR